MHTSYTIAPILILTMLFSRSGLPGAPLPTVYSTFAIQDNPQPYVTLLPKVPASTSSPLLIYPTNTTIWVAGVSTPPNPTGSQIRQFFVDGTSRGVLNLTNVIVGSIVADPTNPTGKLWFTENSTLSFYDTNQAYAVPTSGAIIQGLTVAPGNMLWFAEAGSKKIGRLVPGVIPLFSEFSPPASISLAAPVQVAVDASGNVWFTDHGSNQFGVFD